MADLTEAEMEQHLPVHGGPEQSALGAAGYTWRAPGENT